jgi:hypothetical protein
MRQQRQIFEFDINNLPGMKKDVVDKVTDLPDDKPSYNALENIMDVLDNIQLGGKRAETYADIDDFEKIKKEFLKKGGDLTSETKKILAKEIMHLDISPKEKKQLIDDWKNDRLLDLKLLLTKGEHKFGDLFLGYGEQPGVQELVDALSNVSSQGVGPGEFLFATLSKKIVKAAKGDLEIEGFGTDKQSNLLKIEVKTSRIKHPRFSDDDVRETSEYHVLAKKFVSDYAELFDSLGIEVKQTGLNLGKIMLISKSIKQSKELERSFPEFHNNLHDIISNIFPGYSSEVNKIMNLIETGNERAAGKEWANTNLKYYKDVKKDDGFFYININKEPYTITFFENIDDLKDSNIFLEPSTIYPISFKQRGAYPQIAMATEKETVVSEPKLEKTKAVKIKSTRGADTDRQLRQDVPVDTDKQSNLFQQTQLVDQKISDKSNPISQAYFQRLGQSPNPDRAGSEMQQDITDLLAQGMSDEEVAQELLNVMYESEMSRFKQLLGKAF